MGRGVAVAILAVGGVTWFVVGGAARAADPPREGSPSELGENIKTLVEPARHVEIRLDLGAVATVPRRTNRVALNLEIATRSDFWYGVGVASGSQTTTFTETVTSSGDVQRTLTASEDGVVISARLFKRIGPGVISAGLVDSRPALATELRGWQDRLRLEVIAMNSLTWQIGTSATVRAGGSVQWRWFYLQAGVQDLQTSALRASYWGAGLRWQDPDLHELLAWALR